ncbi:hypothetical protein ZWY2020_005891 [Hordeum vulgare]|nr:hypothetical protein ZWY2020_005891 [Hordeum vulgare]
MGHGPRRPSPAILQVGPNNKSSAPAAPPIPFQVAPTHRPLPRRRRPTPGAAVRPDNQSFLMRRYSSESSSWHQMVSLPTPSEVDSRPSVLVGNILYWPLKAKYILAFELDTLKLYHIECPADTHSVYRRNVHIMKAEDGGLGLAALTEFNLCLWARETVQLKSMQCKKVFEADVPATIFPYTGFYTTGDVDGAR